MVEEEVYGMPYSRKVACSNPGLSKLSPVVWMLVWMVVWMVVHVTQTFGLSVRYILIMWEMLNIFYEMNKKG